MGGSPGLVVMGGDSCPKGFKSWHHIQDGHFFTYICCKNCNDVWSKRPKINYKRGRDWPIFLKKDEKELMGNQSHRIGTDRQTDTQTESWMMFRMMEKPSFVRWCLLLNLLLSENQNIRFFASPRVNSMTKVLQEKLPRINLVPNAANVC